MADPIKPLPRPPLWTWAVTAGLAATILGALTLYETIQTPQSRSTSFNVARLSDTKDASHIVVVIGSSKTRCAIEPDLMFTERLHRLGTDFRMVRFVQDGQIAEDLPEVFQAVIKAKPKLVLLESDLVVLEPRFFWQDNKKHILSWRKKLQITLKSLVISTAAYNRAEDNRGLSTDRSCVYPANQFTNMEAYAAKRMREFAERSTSSAAERAPYLAFIHALRAQGTHIQLLGLPRRPDAAGQLPPTIERAAEGLRTRLARDENLHEVRVTTPVTTASFHDAGHMSPDGRTRVSAWLANYLAKKYAS